ISGTVNREGVRKLLHEGRLPVLGSRSWVLGAVLGGSHDESPQPESAPRTQNPEPNTQQPAPRSRPCYLGAIALKGVLASVLPHISAMRPPSFFMSRNDQVS